MPGCHALSLFTTIIYNVGNHFPPPWTANTTHPQVLERLMMVRHKLAKKVGFQSHAHRTTSDKMAQTPEEVLIFLDALSAGVKKKAEAEASLALPGGVCYP